MGFLAASYLLLLVAVSRTILGFSQLQIKWYLDPIVLFSGCWIVGFSIYTLPIYSYRQEISGQTVLFVMCAHTVFFLGTLLGGSIANFSESSEIGKWSGRRQLAKSTYSFWVLFTFGLIGAIGLISVTANAILTSSLGLFGRFSTDALSQIRAETFGAAAGALPRGPFSQLEQFSAAGYVFIGLIICAPFDGYSKFRKRFLSICAVFCGVLIVFNQLFVRGGRFDIVALLLFLFFIISIRDSSPVRLWLRHIILKRKWSFGVAFLFVVIVVAYYFTVIFVQARSGVGLPLDGLRNYHRLGLSPLADGIVRGSQVLETLMLSLSYLVVPLTTLSFYFDLAANDFAGPFWGQYNFQWLSGFILRRVGEFREWHDFWTIRSEVWSPLRHLGFGTNVWATLLRDLAIDFGWFGSVVAVFIIGVGSRWLAVSAISGRDPALVVAYSFVAIFLVFSFAHSMFHIASVFPPFVYAVALFIFLRLRGSPVNRPRTRPNKSELSNIKS